MTVAHTPTPWEVVGYSDKRTPIEIRTDKPLYPGASSTVLVAKLPHETVNPRANAAFIVLACNSHDALVAALERLTDAVDGAIGRLEDWQFVNSRPIADDLAEDLRAALKAAKVTP